MTEELKRIVEELRKFSTPELCDGAGEYRAMDCSIRQMVTDKKIVGPAFTVSVPEGVGGFIPDAILEVEEGEVLVIEGHGHCRSSYWGDHRSLCARIKGAEGIVIDGAFRDLEGCQEVGFPVFAKALVPGSAAKDRTGEIRVPVTCGGQQVNPGDLIVGDCNGVVVISPSKAWEIMERAKKKIGAQENTIRKMMETGEVIPRVRM